MGFVDVELEILMKMKLKLKTFLLVVFKNFWQHDLMQNCHQQDVL